MIIIEGPDNSGKSTLLRRLVKDLGLTVAHKVGGVPHTPEDLYIQCRDILNLSIKKSKDSKKVIVDRLGLFSETIYGPVFRGHNKWDKITPQRKSITEALYSLDPFIIYCRPPMETILDLTKHEVKNYDTKEHLDKINTKLGKIVNSYDSYFKFWEKHHFFKYDYTQGNSYEELLFLLKEYIK